ncbi:DUF3597 family protein [Sphingomonas sp. Y38-1Y]|uniref:DUF3597 family protein n=1 Tax=Sphingomonas sp. Y38-1Y TaxID=3078265 RepID=UPI0028EC0EB3|nr:DUF3597 family protein [Sphingomonas sp. Y38-1Y]
MGLFASIKDKIFGHKAQAPAAPRPTPTPAAQAAAAPAASAPAQPAAPQQSAPASQPVDVGAVLSEMASMKGGGGNYQSSIVDLLKLLDLDSSLQARRELADELGVHAGDHGSAEQNIALHRAVMAKLAENGGVVPNELRN